MAGKRQRAAPVVRALARADERSARFSPGVVAARPARRCAAADRARRCGANALN